MTITDTIEVVDKWVLDRVDPEKDRELIAAWRELRKALYRDPPKSRCVNCGHEDRP